MMNKYKTILGIEVIIASLVIIALLITLVAYFPITQTLILKIVGPLIMMALFIGMFLFFSGMFQKTTVEETKNIKSGLKKKVTKQ